jgi:hypothetical protein
MGKNTITAKILFNHHLIAVGYLSQHPSIPQKSIASIIPIEYFGSFTNDSREVRFTKPIHDVFEADVNPASAFQAMAAQAEIEPEKVEFLLSE